jgi:hypothetical protein
MIQHADTTVMFALLLLIGLLAICVLGAVYGVDSRIDERVHRGSTLR